MFFNTIAKFKRQWNFRYVQVFKFDKKPSF